MISAIVAGSGNVDGVPVVGCDCKVCKSTDPKDERMRSSVFVEIKSCKNKNKCHIIFDCGNDFREQALNARVWNIASIFITDSQCANCLGVNDTRPFKNIGMTEIWADPESVSTLKKKFFYAFNETQAGGGLPEFVLQNTCSGKPIVLDLKKDPRSTFYYDAEDSECKANVVPFECFNKRRKSNGYRLGNFAYLPDCKFIPEESINILRGVEILLVSCSGIRVRKNRMNIEDALAIIKAVGAKTNILTRFTHDNTNSEIEEYVKKVKTERTEFENIDIIAAFDGMRIEGIKL